MPILNIDIQIDTSDLWCEEGESLNEVLKTSIRYEVVSAVEKQAQAAINNCVDQFVRSNVDEKIKVAMDQAVKEMIDGGMKFTPRYSKEEVSVRDYVHLQFGNHGVNEAIGDYVKKEANKLAEELKRQYDVKFASKIVEGIANQGLLKPEAAKILLGDL